MYSSPNDTDWLNKPWIYSEPKTTELKEKWIETWSNYLLEFAEKKSIHLINISDLRREERFSKLSPESFEEILHALLQRGYGRWWGKKGKLLRIYWRSIDKWVDHILQISKEKEIRVIDGIQGLIELEPLIATIPSVELEQILTLLVDRDFARWIEKKKHAIRIIR